MTAVLNNETRGAVDDESPRTLVTAFRTAASWRIQLSAG